MRTTDQSIGNQRQPEGVTLLVAMSTFAERNNPMCLERIEDRRDGFQRNGRAWWRVLRHANRRAEEDDADDD